MWSLSTGSLADSRRYLVVTSVQLVVEERTIVTRDVEELMTLTMEVLVAVVWVREYALLPAFDVRYNKEYQVNV